MASPLKLMAQFQTNFAEMFLSWLCTKITIMVTLPLLHDNSGERLRSIMDLLFYIMDMQGPVRRVILYVDRSCLSYQGH